MIYLILAQIIHYLLVRAVYFIKIIISIKIFIWIRCNYNIVVLLLYIYLNKPIVQKL